MGKTRYERTLEELRHGWAPVGVLFPTNPATKRGGGPDRVSRPVNRTPAHPKGPLPGHHLEQPG